ncbi:hypothetical protein GE21DRAFT_1102371 [Neurospora crassa]|nr:hypothetical protein GE21DRAFT_1102371 [Neurospora crassa]
MGILRRSQLVSDFWFPLRGVCCFFFFFVHVVISVLLSTFCLYYYYFALTIGSRYSFIQGNVSKGKKKWIHIDLKFSQKESESKELS